MNWKFIFHLNKGIEKRTTFQKYCEPTNSHQFNHLYTRKYIDLLSIYLFGWQQWHFFRGAQRSSSSVYQLARVNHKKTSSGQMWASPTSECKFQVKSNKNTIRSGVYGCGNEKSLKISRKVFIILYNMNLEQNKHVFHVIVQEKMSIFEI